MKTKILVSVLIFIQILMGTALAAKPIITADTTYFDIKTGLYMLKGNVYIEVKNRVITAEQARVNIASFEVWGTGGVTVTQDDIYFSGENVYVYGTKDRAKVDGGVNFSRTNLSIVADKAEYNWRTKIGNFTGNVKITQNGQSWTADLVSYNVKTNTFL